MEFYRIWRILLGYKWTIVGLPIIATCVAVATAYALPEQYASTALVLVRPLQTLKVDSEGSDRKEVLNFPVSEAAPIDAPGKTYIEVILSPAIAIKIVEALHLDAVEPIDPATQSLKDKARLWIKDTIRLLRNYGKYGRDIPASAFDRAVEDVQANLAATIRKDTYAFDISYRSGDPNQAADVANTAAQMFLEYSSDAYRREAARTRAFIDAQLSTSRTTLDTARSALLAFQSSDSGLDPRSEFDVQNRNVADLENTLAKAEAKLASLRRSNASASPFVLASEGEVAELRRQIAIVRTQLGGYPKKAGSLDSLTLALRVAQERYEFFLKRSTEARLREAAISNEIRVISRALPDPYPLKPVKIVYAGLSFAVALGIAVGWALFLEALDPRIRTIHGLDEALGLPVLGVLPRLSRSWSRVRLAGERTQPSALGTATLEGTAPRRLGPHRPAE